MQGNQDQGQNAIVIGRIVWHNKSLTKGEKRFDKNNQPVMNKQNVQVNEWAFGLAVPLTEFGQGKSAADFWAKYYAEIFKLYPSGQTPNDFATKMKKETDIDKSGAPYATRTGYKDAYVFTMKTQVAPTFLRWNTTINAYEQIVSEEVIENGDYVSVNVQIRSHPSKGEFKAGMYLNPNGVCLLQKGEKIVNKPDAEQMFGAQAPGMPFAAPGPAAPPQMPGQPQAPTAFPQAAAPMPMAQPQYQQPVQPHHAVLPQHLQPAAPMPMAQPQYQQPGYPAPQQAAPNPSYPQPMAPAGYAGHPPAMPTPGATSVSSMPYPGNPAVPQYPGIPQPR